VKKAESDKKQVKTPRKTPTKNRSKTPRKTGSKKKK
jgi:hypothetical protein